MKKIVRYIAIGTPEVPSSHVWRFWMHKDEFYFGAKSMLGVFKTSLHKSGIWRIAFVKELERKEDFSNDRVIQEWHRPDADEFGLTPSVAILISSIHSTRPFDKKKIDDSRIEWFSTPTLDRKLNLKVVFSNPGISEENFKKLLPLNVKPVCHFDKTNGERIWLILIESDLTEVEKQKILDVMLKTRIHFVPGADTSSVDSRALLLVSEIVPTSETQPTILDIELGQENLTFDSSDRH